jgi:hypothetical protein
MAWIPKFRLYASNGSTLLYTFPAVSYTNLPQTQSKNTVIEGIRGNGCIVISGSTSSWDIVLQGVLLATNFEAVTVLIDALESAIPTNSCFILTFDKTPSTSYSYHVKRINPIEFNESLRTNYQEYKVTLLANSW